jgi:Fe-S-cluster-containing dehydrogenase component/DMSO reductase anchor subunit
LTDLLAEQQQLSAVEVFSKAYDHSRPAREHRYRALLPATPPGPGEQYAFEVDLDRCSGCKACVAACHSLNGLDDCETWRDVGLLIGGTQAAPVMQHVTTACHHCITPACMIACPVNAYEKDSVTGIVKHLDDQCFGCQYCTLACPYEAPKYHAAKGIVRKCDMCSSRLAAGEAPACVQSCPHEAISIRVVNKEHVREDAEATNFLPAAPDQQITLPTTTYKTTKSFPRNLLPADYYRVGPQHAHVPLAFMLVLTQLSVGAFIVGLVLNLVLPAEQAAAISPLLAASALLFGIIALAASLFHLGRPWLAFRAVLGLRHSWLSREIVAFGAFAGLATCYAAAAILLRGQGPALVRGLEWAVGASGIAGLFCSVMIYAFTQRECWSFARVMVRFALTATVLGVAVVWLSILILTLANPSPALSGLVQDHAGDLCRVLLTAAALKLLFEAAILRHLWPQRMTALKRSALLMTGELANFTLARFAAGILGGVIMPAFLLAGTIGAIGGDGSLPFTIIVGMLFVACLAGELLERYLFFTACASPRMPGAIR